MNLFQNKKWLAGVCSIGFLSIIIFDSIHEKGHCNCFKVYDELSVRDDLIKPPSIFLTLFSYVRTGRPVYLLDWIFHAPPDWLRNNHPQGLNYWDPSRYEAGMGLIGDISPTHSPWVQEAHLAKGFSSLGQVSNSLWGYGVSIPPEPVSDTPIEAFANILLFSGERTLPIQKKHLTDVKGVCYLTIYKHDAGTPWNVLIQDEENSPLCVLGFLQNGYVIDYQIPFNRIDDYEILEELIRKAILCP